MSEEYMSELIDAYHHYYHYYNRSPLLVVDTRNLDFVDRSEDFEELVRQVSRPVKGTQYYVPLGSPDRRGGRGPRRKTTGHLADESPVTRGPDPRNGDRHLEARYRMKRSRVRGSRSPSVAVARKGFFDFGRTSQRRVRRPDGEHRDQQPTTHSVPWVADAPPAATAWS